jgi:hypothetical protein
MREKHIFGALDHVVARCERLKFPDPWDGRILGAFASVILRNDPTVIGFLRDHSVGALNDAATADEMWRLMGQLAAEHFLKARKDKIPEETRLSPPEALLDAAEELFEHMRLTGLAMATDQAANGAVSVTLPNLTDPLDLGKALLDDAFGAYVSLIPETDDTDGVPDPVERHAIAKAAFLHMTLDDLKDQAAEDGFDDVTTRYAAAERLAEKYKNEWEKVAEIVLRREKGDSQFGLVTRLLPLTKEADLDAAYDALSGVKGRFYEPRVAAFFIFDSVERSGNVLTVTGRVRSFTVSPEEAGGATLLNTRAFKDSVTIVLREGVAWAEVTARRVGDLRTIRVVLRKTGAVRPATTVDIPAALTKEPFSDWDARTVWMLDFLRRDLQAPALRLDNTLMAHFLAREPDDDEDDGTDEEPSDDAADGAPESSAENGDVRDGSGAPSADEGGESKRDLPAVDAVRLDGNALHRHPEACSRIASGARLRDLEVRVRKVTDTLQGYSKLVRIRLSRDDDHIAVFSGAADGKLDAGLHREIVQLVRAAANRPLDEDGLAYTLKSVQRLADGGQVDPDAEVFEEDADDGGEAASA